MTIQSLNLLRRTFVACLTLAATALSGNAFAQTFTCSNPTITPNNSFTITCNPQSAPVAGAAGTFSVSGPASLTVSTSGTITISRSGGSTGAYSVAWNATGQCTGSGTASFADGSTASVNGTVSAGASQGSCSVALAQPVFVSGTQGTGASSGAAWPISITAGSNPNPQPQPGNCPAATYTDVTLSNNGSSSAITLIRMTSGTIGTFALPNTNPGHRSAAFYPGTTSTSPAGGTLEVTISKCKGEINPSAGACYMRTQTFDGSGIFWVSVPVAYDDATLTSWGMCNAQASAGPWYVNVKYTFSSCSFGSACGYSWSWYDAWL